MDTVGVEACSMEKWYD